MKRNLLLRSSTILAICFGFSVSYSQSGQYFKNFPKEASPAEIGKKVAEKFMITPHTFWGILRPQTDPPFITYPDVCAWFGAFKFAAASADKELSAKLLTKTEKLFNEETKLVPLPNHVDNSVYGIIPFSAYAQSKDEKFLKQGVYFADEQFKKLSSDELTKLTPEVKTWYESGLSWQTRFWIDDMFMITALQSKAYIATGDKKYINRAAMETIAYLDKLQNENGLFYHAPDVPFYWGRGDGWMAVGMADLLKVLPQNHPDRKRIMEGYLKMMNSLLQYQDAKGMWHQLIDDPNAWPETSSTGMFTYAFIVGVKNGWLNGKTFGAAARKAWIQLVTYFDESYAIKDVCEGTNKLNSHQYYLDRKKNLGDLHGQAPILWCAAALLENTK